MEYFLDCILKYLYRLHICMIYNFKFQHKNISGIPETTGSGHFDCLIRVKRNKALYIMLLKNKICIN